jgi:hypothetical protein
MDPISNASAISVTAGTLVAVLGVVAGGVTAWTMFRLKLGRLEEKVDELRGDHDKSEERISTLEHWRSRLKGATQAVRRARTGPVDVTGAHLGADEDSGNKWPNE